jgi:hypothetical protein
MIRSADVSSASTIFLSCKLEREIRERNGVVEARRAVSGATLRRGRHTASRHQVAEAYATSVSFTVAHDEVSDDIK